MSEILVGIISFFTTLLVFLIQYILYYFHRFQCCDQISSIGYPLHFYSTGGFLGISKFSIGYLCIDLAFWYFLSFLLVFFLKENYQKIHETVRQIHPSHKVYFILITLLVLLLLFSQLIEHRVIFSSRKQPVTKPKLTIPTKSPIKTPTPSLSQIVQSPIPPEPVETWRRVEYPHLWSFAHPTHWNINEGGLIEGRLLLKGAYGSGIYQVFLSYPIIDPSENSSTSTLIGWVSKVLETVPLDKRETIEIFDTTIAQAQAKVIYNFPDEIYNDGKNIKYSEKLSHVAYIWQRGEINPRFIQLTSIGDRSDPVEMKKLFDLFISEIR